LISLNENGITMQPYGRAFYDGENMSVQVPRERIEQTILVIRGHKVILD